MLSNRLPPNFNSQANRVEITFPKAQLEAEKECFKVPKVSRKRFQQLEASFIEPKQKIICLPQTVQNLKRKKQMKDLLLKALSHYIAEDFEYNETYREFFYNCLKSLYPASFCLVINALHEIQDQIHLSLDVDFVKNLILFDACKKEDREIVNFLLKDHIFYPYKIQKHIFRAYQQNKTNLLALFLNCFLQSDLGTRCEIDIHYYEDIFGANLLSIGKGDDLEKRADIIQMLLYHPITKSIFSKDSSFFGNFFINANSAIQKMIIDHVLAHHHRPKFLNALFNQICKIKDTDSEVLKVFIKAKKGDLIPQIEGAFYYACESGNLQVIQLLLAEFEPNLIDKLNNGFEKACKNNSVEVVYFFIKDLNIDISFNQNAALRIARNFENLEIVRLLIRNSKIKFS